MSFKKNKYSVLKNAISKELANFVYDYFKNKRNVAKVLFDSRYISPFTEYWGIWNDEQVPNTYSHYSDIAIETLLESSPLKNKPNFIDNFIKSKMQLKGKNVIKKIGVSKK